MQDVEQTIRDRAYHLWPEGGCQDGHADAHWLVAQREVVSGSLSALGHVDVSNPAAKPKKVRAGRKKQRAA